MTRAHCLLIAATLLASAAPSNATIEFVRGDSISVESQSELFCVADFNHDGIDDLALAASRSEEVDILFGSPGARFLQGPILRLGHSIAGIACGDLNHDCNPDAVGLSCQPNIDIAVADASHTGVRGFWTIIGHGDGTFEAPVQHVIDGASNLSAIAIGDMNNDGANDVVVGGRGFIRLFVMLNDGGKPPFFSKGGDIAVGILGPDAVVLGNFDGDAANDIDIAILDNSNRSNIFIIRNDGNIAGTPMFRTIQYIGFRSSEVLDSMQAADINLDGVPDLILRNNPSGMVTGEIVVLLAVNNGGTVLFGEPLRTAVPCPFENDGTIACRTRGLGTGDFDQDGIIDVAVSIQDGRRQTMTDFVTFFRGRGDGHFFAKTTLDTDLGAKDVIVGQFSLADPYPDVAVAAHGKSNINLYVNISVPPMGPGYCAFDDECASEVCLDNVCCAQRCRSDETCAVPSALGECVPLHDNGMDCVYAQECFSNACVDDVCCSNTCSEEHRCDIFGFEGLCRQLVESGGQCNKDSDCVSGFCVNGICCQVAACFPDELCAAPNGQCILPPPPTATPSAPDENWCFSHRDCPTPLFCTNRVCCVSANCDPGECGIDGHCVSPPTRTPTSQPPLPIGTQNPGGADEGGCDRGEGRSPSGMEFLLAMLLPAGLWIARRRSAAVME